MRSSMPTTRTVFICSILPAKKLDRILGLHINPARSVPWASKPRFKGASLRNDYQLLSPVLLLKTPAGTPGCLPRAHATAPCVYPAFQTLYTHSPLFPSPPPPTFMSTMLPRPLAALGQSMPRLHIVYLLLHIVLARLHLMLPPRYLDGKSMIEKLSHDLISRHINIRSGCKHNSALYITLKELPQCDAV